MINIIICDDDLALALKLKEVLLLYFEKFSLKTEPKIFVFESGMHLLEWYIEYNCHKEEDLDIDFLFIDVEMPDLNGIKTVESLLKYGLDTIIIFISNYTEYVFDSFEAKPFSYILKPFDPIKLEQLMNRGLHERQKRLKKIFVYCDKKHLSLSYDTIIMIESFGKKTIIHTIHGDYETSIKISDFEEKLNTYNFLRSHRSFLVNMEKILYYENFQFFLVENHIADISQRKRAKIIKKFKKYILKQEIGI